MSAPAGFWKIRKNEVFVSVVSAWEISIKRTLGKMRAPDNLKDAAEKQGFIALYLNFLHTERLGALPLHHGDPFDRILVAQALVEKLVLVTKDQWMSLYEVKTISS